MNKYIDAEKLISEIERLKEETPIGICEYDKGEENGRMEVLISLQSTIASLQQEQPEVDLEDIIRVEFATRAKVEDGRRYVKLNWDKFSILARHLYELGRTRKEE